MEYQLVEFLNNTIYYRQLYPRIDPSRNIIIYIYGQLISIIDLVTTVTKKIFKSL